MLTLKASLFIKDDNLELVICKTFDTNFIFYSRTWFCDNMMVSQWIITYQSGKSLICIWYTLVSWQTHQFGTQCTPELHKFPDPASLARRKYWAIPVSAENIYRNQVYQFIIVDFQFLEKRKPLYYAKHNNN